MKRLLHLCSLCMLNLVLKLTVINSFSSFAALTIKESDSCHNQCQFIKLPFFITFCKGHECSQFCLRKHALQSSCRKAKGDM